MGTVVLGMLVPPILWLFVYSMIRCFFPQFDKFNQKITDLLFWDKTIAFFQETYILLAICSFINMWYDKWDSFGNALNSLVSYLMLTAVIGFPIVVGVFYSGEQSA